MKNMFKNRKLRFLIVISLPVIMLCLSLLCFMSELMFLYLSKCYPEVIAIAIGWLMLWGFVFLWRKLSGENPVKKVMVLALILVTMIASYPYARRVASARYIFYKNGLYGVTKQDVEHIYAALYAFESGDYEYAKSHIDSCGSQSRKFFSYSIGKLLRDIAKVEVSKEQFSKILENYELNPSIFALYGSMATDFGGSFKEEYLIVKRTIADEINSIDGLYLAVMINDDGLCKELISKHGYYWFEPEIQEMLLASDDCVSLLKKMVIKYDDGQQFKLNLKNVWGF